MLGRVGARVHAHARQPAAAALVGRRLTARRLKGRVSKLMPGGPAAAVAAVPRVAGGIAGRPAGLGGVGAVREGATCGDVGVPGGKVPKWGWVCVGGEMG